MNKEQIINEIRRLASERQISHDEVNQAFYSGLSSPFTGKTTASKSAINASGGSNFSSHVFSFKEHLSVSKILYTIGSLVVIIGIVVLVTENWNVLNSLARVVITLGSGVALYVAGVLFSRREDTQYVSGAFMFMSAVLIPIGISVSLYEGGYNLANIGVQVLLSGIMTALYIVSLLLYRKTLFAFFSLAFGTWLFYSSVFFLLQGSSWLDFDIYSYFIVVFGITHILIGYFLSSTQKKILSPLLYGVGAIEILGPTIALGEFWDVVYILPIFCIMYLSTYLKSKVLLIIGSGFLMGYLIKITGKYFTDSIGWAFALIVSGFILIGVGYFAVYLNRKYIKG